MKLSADARRELFDALYCCSRDNTRGNAVQTMRARGILVGVVMGLRAAGLSVWEAWRTVRMYLPSDVDPACVPDNWDAEVGALVQRPKVPLRLSGRQREIVGLILSKCDDALAESIKVELSEVRKIQTVLAQVED